MFTFSTICLIFTFIQQLLAIDIFPRRHGRHRHNWQNNWDGNSQDSSRLGYSGSSSNYFARPSDDQRSNQRIHQQRSSSTTTGRGKMNAAGFFYISADFPMTPNEEQQQQEPFEDLANEDCSMYPNGTYKAPYAFTCSDPERGPPLLVVHDTALANRSGHYEYPLDLSDGAPMLRVFMDLTSFATRSFESMRAEVVLLRRKVGWLGCGWIPIPSFGAFDSMDVCEANDSCPIFPGRQVLELRLEPSAVFLAMLRLMLHDDKPPYELRIRLINNRSHGEELLCVAFQTRLIF